ncbi:MAG: hypothetical protein V7L20_04020, partial [Nostoc sp.]|uniref:hypothetical protein n=1 Tax=Nostoc sp. TaxID=1180 RepID=UPI002FF8D10A
QPTLDRISTFVVGSNGHLYDKFYNGSQWVWEEQGTPPSATVIRPSRTRAINSPGVVYQPTLDRISTFVVGSNGHLYDKFYNGSQWVWEDQGTP